MKAYLKNKNENDGIYYLGELGSIDISDEIFKLMQERENWVAEDKYLVQVYDQDDCYMYKLIYRYSDEGAYFVLSGVDCRCQRFREVYSD